MIFQHQQKQKDTWPNLTRFAWGLCTLDYISQLASKDGPLYMMGWVGIAKRMEYAKRVICIAKEKMFFAISCCINGRMIGNTCRASQTL